MNLTFVPKEADKAYVSRALWLPKRLIRVGPVKKALEFTVPGREGQVQMSMWEESSTHLICPREFLPIAEYPRYKFPFIDLRPQFSRTQFEDLVVPRNEEQQKAWDALSKNDNGILQLGCGKGKTKLALKKIAQRGVPTLVIVPDGGMLEQWKASIRGDSRTPPGLRFDGELGIVQGPSFSWAKPLTLALVTTLALRIRDGGIPEEFFRYFGQIIYDEVHQIGAPIFSLTAYPFYGDRIGLTATVEREDGLDPIYRYHIGEPFYADLKQDLIPRIYFEKTSSAVEAEEAKVNGITNVSKLRSILGRDYASNVYRYYSIKEAVESGRKVIALSHSKDQLRLFHAMFPGSGLIIQETDREDRLNVLRNSNPCFAIAKLGSTGVDDDRLDTLFWLTPFKSKIALQQSMGRIQRALEGKKTPVMVVFEDWSVVPLRRLCQELKGRLREWSLKFEATPPRRFPQELSAEVHHNYMQVFNQLPANIEEVEDEL